MAYRISTGMRDALLGGTNGTAGLKTLMNNGWLDIRTGSQPVSADAIETGTFLVRISSTSGIEVADGCKFGTASVGILPLTVPKWQGEVKVSGVAGWWRFYGSSSTGGLTGTSGTAIRMDGNCGGAGADLALSHTSLDAETTLTIKTAFITQPAE